MTRFSFSTTLLWAGMLWPALPVLRGLLEGGWYLAEMLHISGVWSVYLLVATVAVTPLSLLMGRLRWIRAGRWLIAHRRHLGLGAFVHAALHSAHYVQDAGDLGTVLGETLWPAYAPGWVGMLIFLALAGTSNARSVRALGQKWKALHRGVYVAAAAIFLHWVLVMPQPRGLLLWGGLFVLAKAVHVALRRLPRQTAKG